MHDIEFFIQKQLDYCVEQATKTLAELPENSMIPRNIAPDEKKWNLVDYEDWTSGFGQESYGNYMNIPRTKYGKTRQNTIVSCWFLFPNVLQSTMI